MNWISNVPGRSNESFQEGRPSCKKAWETDEQAQKHYDETDHGRAIGEETS